MQNEKKEMIRRTVIRLVGAAVIASAIANLVWSYLSWHYKLGVGTIYVWPWVLITTLLYGYRAMKLGLYSSRLGIIARDLRQIRVGSLPFLAAMVLPLLNFAFNQQAPAKIAPIVLVASGVSWSLYDLIALLSGWRQGTNFGPGLLPNDRPTYRGKC